MDYPGRIDFFDDLDLKEGETLFILVDTMNFDLVLLITFPDAAEDPVVTEDHSGGGIFGLNSQIICQASKDGEYFISVSDSAGFDVGDYALTVSVAPPGAGAALIPDAPIPIESDFGPMELYESNRYSFSIQHPMGWESLHVDPQDLAAGWATQKGSAFTIEDLVTQTSESFSLAEYIDLVITVLPPNLSEFELLSSEPLLTVQCLAPQVLEFTARGGS